MSHPSAPYAKPRLPAVTTAIRALAGFFLPQSKDAFPAAEITTASPQPKPDGAALLSQRAALIERARQSKPRSEARARLINQVCSVTTDILRRGKEC